MQDDRRSEIEDGRSADLAGSSSGEPALVAVGLPAPSPCSGSGEGGFSPIAVSHNLPAVPAIGDAELNAIERYMADVLDLVLGGTDSATAASSRHKRLS